SFALIQMEPSHVPGTTTKYTQNWDLDSLLPSPAGEEFSKILEAYRRDLEALAEQSDQLPPVSRNVGHALPWGVFLAEYTRLEMQAADLSSFIGCHAAADAANKLYRKFEAALSALDPLRERISTNVEFALRDASDTDFNGLLASHSATAQIAFFLAQ